MYKTLHSKNNTFRFVFRKNSSTEPVFADNPAVESAKITNIIQDHFRSATITSEVKVTTAGGLKISDWRREYLILVTIVDHTIDSSEFNDFLNDVAEELRYMGIEY